MSPRELKILDENCPANLRCRDPTRADLQEALEYLPSEFETPRNSCLRCHHKPLSGGQETLECAEAARDLANGADLSLEVLVRCESYRRQCMDRITWPLDEDDNDNYEHLTYSKSTARHRATDPGDREDSNGDMNIKPTPAVESAQESMNKGPHPPVKFSQPLVGMRDQNGNRMPAKRVPELRPKSGQSFDGWRNTL